MSPVYIPGKVILQKEFIPENSMYDYPYTFNIWSPVLLSPSMWFDADDTDTITQSGGLVSVWADKSGNNRNATKATEAYRPTYNPTYINGKPAIEKILGSNSNIGLSTPALGIAANSPRSTAFVFRHQTVNTDNNELFGVNTVYMVDAAGGSTSGDWKFRNNTISLDGTPNALTSGNRIMVIRGSSSLTSYRQDGGSDSGESAVNAYAWSANTTTQGINFFTSNVADRQYRAGGIGEFIMFPSYLDATQTEKVEGYLAHKWGLTANLPADHPYKLVRPTP
jgi:hypothetical protein